MKLSPDKYILIFFAVFLVVIIVYFAVKILLKVMLKTARSIIEKSDDKPSAVTISTSGDSSKDQRVSENHQRCLNQSYQLLHCIDRTRKRQNMLFPNLSRK